MAWAQLLGQLDEQIKLLPHTIGAWSVKDVIAHVMSYEQYIADRTQGLVDGLEYTPAASAAELDAFVEKYGYPDFGSALLDDDEPNAWVVQKYGSIPLSAVEAKARRVFSQLINALTQLTDDELTTHDWFSRVANNTYLHYAEHKNDLQRLLDQNIDTAP